MDSVAAPAQRSEEVVDTKEGSGIVLHGDVPCRGVAARCAEARGALLGALLRLEDEMAALEEIDEADALRAAFVRDGDRLLENVGVALRVRGGRMRRVDIQNLAEIVEERLRIRPLRGAGVDPLLQEFGGSQGGRVYRKGQLSRGLSVGPVLALARNSGCGSDRGSIVAESVCPA